MTYEDLDVLTATTTTILTPLARFSSRPHLLPRIAPSCIATWVPPIWRPDAIYLKLDELYIDQHGTYKHSLGYAIAVY